jgi:mycofactocin precursor
MFLALSATIVNLPLRTNPGDPQEQERPVEYVNPNLENNTTEDADLVIEDLVEDVSIDGMCGVY